MLQFEKFKIKHELVPDSIYYIPDFLQSSTEENQLIHNVLAAPKPKWTYLSNRSLQNWGGLPHPKGMVQEPLPEWLDSYIEKLNQMQVFDGKRPNHVLVNRYLPGQGIMAHEDGPLFYPTVATINTGSHTVLNFYRKSTTTTITTAEDPPVSKNGNDCPKEEEEEETREQQRRSLPNYCFSLLLLPRSLLILKHEAYTSFLHEIEPFAMDRIDESLNHSKIVNLNIEQIRKYMAALTPTTSNQFQTDSSDMIIERSVRYSFTIRNVPKVLKINLQSLLFNKK